MRFKSQIVTLALFALAITLRAADDPFVGTWKINNAKSRQASPPKSQINKFEAVPNGVKFTLDAEDQKGNKTHQEYTAYFDGKDYPVTGDSNSDKISRKRIDDYHTLSIRKKGAQIVNYRASSVSKGGKTYTTRLVDAQGKPVDKYFQVFDRQ